MERNKQRTAANRLIDRLKKMPAVALLGPRQCGKTTLAKQILRTIPDSIYLDLEKTSDLNKLSDPEAFFSLNTTKLICLDEIQRLPDIFPIMRSVIDQADRSGQFLILGSASRDLIRQGSETLAGRLSFLELSPFLLDEVGAEYLRPLWLRGGFPRSFLAEDNMISVLWRNDFIRTYLERDIPQLGFNIPPLSIERLWKMCAHNHGQTLNASNIGSALGVSHHTVKTYIDILNHTFLLRVLPPFVANLKKRLVKTPKIYIRDSGVLHALLDIGDHNDLLGHPIYGGSFEGFSIEHAIAATPDWSHSFYRTAGGAELDLILTKGQKMIAVECKSSMAPRPTKGFFQAIEDLSIREAYLVAPVTDAYPIERNVQVLPLSQIGTIARDK